MSGRQYQPSGDNLLFINIIREVLKKKPIGEMKDENQVSIPPLRYYDDGVVIRFGLVIIHGHVQRVKAR